MMLYSGRVMSSGVLNPLPQVAPFHRGCVDGVGTDSKKKLIIAINKKRITESSSYRPYRWEAAARLFRQSKLDV